jgi:hypothetical protein
MNYLKPAAVVLLAVAFGPAVAFSDGSTESMPVAYPIQDPQPTPQTCDVLKRDAEFLRELRKTDGDVNPEPVTIECNEKLATKE